MTGRGRRPRVVLVGGPDVDQRLDLMDHLRADFELQAVGSEPALGHRFSERGYAYRSYTLDRGFNLGADLRSALELARVFDELRPDLVHAFDTKPAVVARLAARRAGVAVIVGTLPGLGALWTYDTPPVRRRRAVFRVLHRLADRASAATVFQNRDDLDLFVDAGIVQRRRAVLIEGSGLALERFPEIGPRRRTEARRKLGLDADVPVVLAVTRLVRSKGLEELAAAAEAVSKRQPGVRFLVAGARDPEALDALSAEEVTALGRHLEFLGPRQDVPDLLAAADVFAFPSRYREGVPRALVEAAASGVPIVAAEGPGSSTVLTDEESGLLVPPGDSAALADAIERLLADLGLAILFSNRARQDARSRFAIDSIGELHRRLYRRLLRAS